jgi:N-acetylmuramoyl-L-alanine amidase
MTRTISIQYRGSAADASPQEPVSPLPIRARVACQEEQPMPDDPTDIVARTMWGEARGAGVEGMTAVAAVIGNRAANPRWWGSDLISVCQKPWQFSCWNVDDPNLPKLEAVDASDPQFAEALVIAASLVAGTLLDPTNNADSYYDLSIPAPSWAGDATFTVQIGNMRFYRVVLEGPAAAA